MELLKTLETYTKEKYTKYLEWSRAKNKSSFLGDEAFVDEGKTSASSRKRNGMTYVSAFEPKAQKRFKHK